MTPSAAPPPIPSNVAWRGLAATGLAALLAGLSAQAHGLAQADLGGSMGVSADDASWVVSAGTMAEGAAVLIASPLVAAAGIRTVVAWACIVAGLLAVAIGAAPDLTTAVPLRFVQSFAAGLLPVAMMGWALRAFSAPHRGLPLMLFAFVSSAPSALAALLAGAMTSHWGGRGDQVFDILWTPVALATALVLLPREARRLDRFRDVDWVGYALLSSGVMLALLVLTQGERRFWLETSWMAPLIAAAGAFSALGLAWLVIAPKPLLDLRLLGSSSFGLGLAEALSLRFGLLLASFAVPPALARRDGFRLEYAGPATLWLLAGQVVGFPAAYLWNRRLDPRWALGAGMAAFAAGSLLAAQVDPTWQGEQFVPALIVAGLGQGLYLTSVMSFATTGVPPAAGATAAGLFNLTRVLGTAGSTTGVAFMLRVRENFHSARLVDGVSSANAAGAARLAGLIQGYAAITSDTAAASRAAETSLATTLSTQAYGLAFSDVFIGIAATLAIFALLVPLLPRLPSFREGARP